MLFNTYSGFHGDSMVIYHLLLLFNSLDKVPDFYPLLHNPFHALLGTILWEAIGAQEIRSAELHVDPL